MKKFIVRALAVLLATFCTNASAPASAGAGELIVAAAASLTDVTKDIAKLYKTKAPDVMLTFTYGASGALQQQIEEGAPVDVFISAAKKQMNALEKKGLIHGSGKDLLINRIVLIVPAGSSSGIKSFKDTGTDKVKMIAFGNPATTPAGQYGQEILKGLGIVDAVNAKANLGSDVRQVLTWVEMGEVDCGIVFMTDALTTNKVKVVAIAEDGSHSPAIYPVGIIKASSNKKEAQKFVGFLSSSGAKAIFEKHGFSMPK